MKLKSLLVGILLSGITFAQNIPNYVSTNGLVVYYSFNGNANDATSNANNGTVNGATLTTDRNGNPNSAYSFDGLSSKISASTSSLLNLANNRTVSVWVKSNNNTSTFDHGIIGYNSTSNKGHNGYMLYLKTDGSYISLEDNYNGTGQGGSSGAPSNGWDGAVSDSKNYSNDVNWHHIVGVRKNDTTRIYVDGVLQSKYTTLVPNFNNSSIIIGYSNLTNQYFKGDIDDIGIWNRALNNEEINELFLGCKTPIATITPSGPTTFCQGSTVTLSTTKDSTYTYQWYNDIDQLQNETKNAITTSTSGKYSVKIINGNCNATSTQTNVTVNTNPTVSLNPIASLIFKNDSSIALVGNPTGGSFTGNGVSGTKFSPSKASLGKKFISYSYTTQEGCSGSVSIQTMLVDTLGNVCTSTKYDTITTHISVTDTLRIKVKLTTGINANKLNSFKAYPNPTSDKLIIDNGDYAMMSGYSITIVDLLGKTVFSTPITTQLITINLNSIGSKGIYHLNIVDGNQSVIDGKQIVLE